MVIIDLIDLITALRCDGSQVGLYVTGPIFMMFLQQSKWVVIKRIVLNEAVSAGN